jgi:hypothetical protein
MGKNPNAKKLKEKRHKNREYETSIDDLEEEAARRGISLFELQEILEKEKEKDSEESGSDESGSEDEETKRMKERQRKQRELEKKMKQ